MCVCVCGKNSLGRGDAKWESQFWDALAVFALAFDAHTGLFKNEKVFLL